MIRVLDVSIDENLRDLSRYLRQQGIPHRIIEESGRQVIFVRDEYQVDPVRELVQKFLSGQLQIKTAAKPAAGHDGRGEAVENSWLYRVLRVIFTAPVSSLLTLICLIVAAVTQMGAAVYRMDFLFYPALPATDLLSLLGAINNPVLFLQTLAPIFLHFGSLHIVFNLLWLWYFGRQLEVIQSSWIFLVLVVAAAFVGNTAQYLSGGASNFGGMSGVVYGLVGYAWILHNFVPGKRLQVNESLFVVFLVALVLMEVLASSWIASAAHLGGLLAGLFGGLCVLLASRVGNGRQT
ncbi:MAG: rhomboid family intramembrane serine protease [Gammaproteobacteria bacterium]|jgi:GlpG protein